MLFLWQTRICRHLRLFGANFLRPNLCLSYSNCFLRRCVTLCNTQAGKNGLFEVLLVFQDNTDPNNYKSANDHTSFSITLSCDCLFANLRFGRSGGVYNLMHQMQTLKIFSDLAHISTTIHSLCK